MKIFLDIETLPVGGEQVALVKEFWEEAKKQSNKRGREITSFDDYMRGTSFQGEFGRIFCICYAPDNDEIVALSGDEKQILSDFWKVAREASLFIGHNVMDFDLRFIYKRSVVLGVKPSRELSFARYRSDPIFDTMREWEKWGAQGVGLHKLCLALGISSPKEEGVDGSQIYDYYLAGRGDEIIEYCKRDVEAVRDVYNKITFQ
jgi:predicted PolB exonuclease-like 3'-5' exonuclease